MAADFDDKDRDEVSYWIAQAFRKLPEAEASALVKGAMAEAQSATSGGIGKRLPEIDLASWIGIDPPPRLSLWGDGWLPVRTLTMLTGAGGIGKSLFAQCLATCVAIGRPFLGMAVTKSKSLYMTAEDDCDELWRRQLAICDVMGITLSQLVGRLFLVSLSGDGETALAQLDLATGRLKQTDRWQEVLGTVDQHGLRLVIVDNATDAMGGDLNDLHQVAEFANQLTGLALRNDGSVLLLHHPNKANDDWLGSVAWHNKVRSRLIIKAGGIEGDPDARMILNPKANYGPQGGQINFRWHRGAFVSDTDLPEDSRARLSESAVAATGNMVFLKCLRECTRRKQAVSGSPSNTFAPTLFAQMPEAKGLGRDKLRAAMNRLFTLHQIETGELSWRIKDRKQATGLREVGADAGDGAADGAADTCGERGRPMPNDAEIRAGDAAENNPSSKEEGAAPWPAAPHSADDWEPFDA